MVSEDGTNTHKHVASALLGRCSPHHRIIVVVVLITSLWDAVVVLESERHASRLSSWIDRKVGKEAS